ncbi:hypothetical protein Mapa_014532 [Marchantia paleacea]|nr:hypothetical protein Mapa_014532 [Marchantia paleacea]
MECTGSGRFLLPQRASRAPACLFSPECAQETVEHSLSRRPGGPRPVLNCAMHLDIQLAGTSVRFFRAAVQLDSQPGYPIAA